MVGRSFLTGLAFEGAGAAWARALPLVGMEGVDVGVIETLAIRVRSADSKASIRSPREIIIARTCTRGSMGSAWVE